MAPFKPSPQNPTKNRAGVIDMVEDVNLKPWPTPIKMRVRWGEPTCTTYFKSKNAKFYDNAYAHEKRGEHIREFRSKTLVHSTKNVVTVLEHALSTLCLITYHMTSCLKLANNMCLRFLFCLFPKLLMKY